MCVCVRETETGYFRAGLYFSSSLVLQGCHISECIGLYGGRGGGGGSGCAERVFSGIMKSVGEFVVVVVIGVCVHLCKCVSFYGRKKRCVAVYCCWCCFTTAGQPVCACVSDVETTEDGRVVVCRDSVRNACKRALCKYYHIPVPLPPST